MAFHKISSALYIISETLSIPLFTCNYNTFHIEVPLPWTIYSIYLFGIKSEVDESDHLHDNYRFYLF